MVKKVILIFGCLAVLGGGGYYVYKLNTPHKGMVWLAGGSYERGCFKCALKDALPTHRVKMSGFWIDETPVTNAQYSQFVGETHYVTVAERTPTAEEFPNVPKENLVPGSAVFTPPSVPVAPTDSFQWWIYQEGASWRQPEGPGSSITDRMDHPVVQVAYEDAVAYCEHYKKRLPTEAEFEFAARGGLVGMKYSWGDELTPGGRWLANIWQGDFPNENENEDGYGGTSPVKSFPPNGFGLYDVSGNVWQWTSDWYRHDYYSTLVASGEEIEDPKGPSDSFDPDQPEIPKRVQRGGSFLCSSRFCTRYLVASRGKCEPSSAASNTGFRCVQDQ